MQVILGMFPLNTQMSVFAVQTQNWYHVPNHQKGNKEVCMPNRLADLYDRLQQDAMYIVLCSSGSPELHLGLFRKIK